MGSSKKPKPDPVLNEVNSMTLARLKREEEQLMQSEAERNRIREAGMYGRGSLLSRGYTGNYGSPVKSLAESRAIDRSIQATTHQENLARQKELSSRGKTGFGREQPAPFTKEQVGWLKKNYGIERSGNPMTRRGN